MAVKIAIIYYSATSTTYQIAKAIEEGAKQAGAETRLLKVKELAPQDVIEQNERWKKHAENTKNVKEATLDDLEWADAIIIGSPTRYGLPSSQLKQFLDTTGPLWGKGALVNKIGSSFTSTATPHGGQESTIIAMNNVFYHWGCIIVSPSYADQIQFESGNPYGSSFTSENGTKDPDKTAISAANYQGRRVAEVTAQFVNGKK